MNSLLDGFSENTNIFRGEEGVIDQSAFEALVKEHGEDVAKGYLKAMVEFAQAMGTALLYVHHNPTRGDTALPSTPTTAYGKMSILHKAIFDFVHNNGANIEGLNEPFPHRTRVKGWD